MKRLKLLEAENTLLRRAVSDLTLDKVIHTEAAGGGEETAKPSRRRWCIEHVREVLGVSERRTESFKQSKRKRSPLDECCDLFAYL